MPLWASRISLNTSRSTAVVTRCKKDYLRSNSTHLKPHNQNSCEMIQHLFLSLSLSLSPTDISVNPSRETEQMLRLDFEYIGNFTRGYKRIT